MKFLCTEHENYSCKIKTTKGDGKNKDHIHISRNRNIDKASRSQYNSGAFNVLDSDIFGAPGLVACEIHQWRGEEHE